MTTLKISEVFYSLQGEGARAGEPSIFVRLQGCSAKHACYASGVVCDTEFESGEEFTLETLEGIMKGREWDKTKKFHCNWIVWTGGEPIDQLTPEILQWFRARGWKQAIETSGIKPITMEFAGYCNHVTVSPKVAEHVLQKNFGHIQLAYEYDTEYFFNVHELRYVRHAGQPGIPEPSLKAS